MTDTNGNGASKTITADSALGATILQGSQGGSGELETRKLPEDNLKIIRGQMAEIHALELQHSRTVRGALEAHRLAVAHDEQSKKIVEDIAKRQETLTATITSVVGAMGIKGARAVIDHERGTVTYERVLTAELAAPSA